MFMGLMAIFGSIKLHWSGAGPLAALTVPFVAAVRWRSEWKESSKNPVEEVLGVLWMIFQPFLFGLIGSEVDVMKLDYDVIGLGIAVLVIGLVFRITVSFLSVFFTNLNYKERLFVAMAWLPKATVQVYIAIFYYFY
uniref:Cation/H+ exchanger transmembrane domain-containing protein n=1 Tax=Biomphalaria glabrata TaxID=6526 RepID=A0A2C9LYR2_BIOGL